MSTTQNEVGQVPSATPTPAAFGGPALIMSIIGIVILSFVGSPAALIIGIVLLFINKKRYRLVGIIGTALSATLMLVTIAYFAVVFGTAAHNFAAPVAATAPEATIAAPQQPAPAVVVPAPNALPTNPVETGPIQPVASTPEGVIRAVEAYRIRAFMTGDPSPLANYFAVGNNSENDSYYWSSIQRVKSVKPGGFLGHISFAVTKIVMVSTTPTKMVANVTVYETANGKVLDDYTYNWRTYEVVNGRWLEIHARNM